MSKGSGYAKFITADGCERIEAIAEITNVVYRVCAYPIAFAYMEEVFPATTQVYRRKYRLFGRLSTDIYEYREEVL